MADNRIGVARLIGGLRVRRHPSQDGWQSSSLRSCGQLRLAATLIVLAAVMPGIFVVVPMVTAIIVTFVVTNTRSDYAGRHDRHQSQQQAGRSNSTHIRILAKSACDSHTRSAKITLRRAG